MCSCPLSTQQFFFIQKPTYVCSSLCWSIAGAALMPDLNVVYALVTGRYPSDGLLRRCIPFRSFELVKHVDIFLGRNRKPFLQIDWSPSVCYPPMGKRIINWYISQKPASIKYIVTPGFNFLINPSYSEKWLFFSKFPVCICCCCPGRNQSPTLAENQRNHNTCCVLSPADCPRTVCRFVIYRRTTPKGLVSGEVWIAGSACPRVAPHCYGFHILKPRRTWP